MTDPIETAVDATLNVAAELARVTAELATLKAGVEQLSNPQAVRVNIYRGTIAKPWPEPHEVGGELVARAEALEKEVERLKAIIADQSRDEQGRVSMPLAAHDKIDAARRERDEATARAEAAQKEIAALRAVLEALCVYAEWARRRVGVAMNTPNSGALDAALNALAAPNLGADWVPRSELEYQQQYTKEQLEAHDMQWHKFTALGEEKHRAQLRRVAEAVRSHCFAVWQSEDDQIEAIDLDAVIAEACK